MIDCDNNRDLSPSLAKVPHISVRFELLEDQGVGSDILQKGALREVGFHLFNSHSAASKGQPNDLLLLRLDDCLHTPRRLHLRDHIDTVEQFGHVAHDLWFTVHLRVDALQIAQRFAEHLHSLGFKSQEELPFIQKHRTQLSLLLEKLQWCMLVFLLEIIHVFRAWFVFLMQYQRFVVEFAIFTVVLDYDRDWFLYPLA